MKTIDVILATYNGSLYIEEQLFSILININKLTDYNCRVLISDDGSSDNTVEIIKGFIKNDVRFELANTTRKGSVVKNFDYLLSISDADYIFFSDQDDFWLPNKLSDFINVFEFKEKSQNKPMLIHSDLVVVDEYLFPKSISMFDSQKLSRETSFNQLLVSNSITGCVMAINRALCLIIKRDSIVNSIMHDWYIGLLASAYGEIHFINKSEILYRQHSSNQIGAKTISINTIIRNGKIKEKINKSVCSIKKTHEQAILFYNENKNFLSVDKKIVLEEYINSFERGFYQRLKCFFKYRIRKSGFLRNIIFFLLYVVCKIK